MPLNISDRFFMHHENLGGLFGDAQIRNEVFKTLLQLSGEPWRLKKENPGLRSKLFRQYLEVLTLQLARDINIFINFSKNVHNPKETERRGWW